MMQARHPDFPRVRRGGRADQKDWQGRWGQSQAVRGGGCVLFGRGAPRWTDGTPTRRAPLRENGGAAGWQLCGTAHARDEAARQREVVSVVAQVLLMLEGRGKGCRPGERFMRLRSASSAGGVPRRLTTAPGEDNNAEWSADGKWIYFLSRRDGTKRTWKIPADAHG